MTYFILIYINDLDEDVTNESCVKCIYETADRNKSNRNVTLKVAARFGQLGEFRPRSSLPDLGINRYWGYGIKVVS